MQNVITLLVLCFNEHVRLITYPSRSSEFILTAEKFKVTLFRTAGCTGHDFLLYFSPPLIQSSDNPEIHFVEIIVHFNEAFQGGNTRPPCKFVVLLRLVCRKTKFKHFQEIFCLQFRAVKPFLNKPGRTPKTRPLLENVCQPTKFWTL